MISFSTVLALVAILASIYLFAPHSPSRQKAASPLRGEPFKFAGPVLSASTSSLTLDGLTVIPLMNLPPIRISFAIPFTTNSFFILLNPSASELVFSTLRIATLSFKALDATRDPVHLKLAGIDTKFEGNIAFGFSFGVRDKDKVEIWKSRKRRTVGRLKTDLKGARLSLSAQLVASASSESQSPLISVLSTLFHEGDDTTFHLSSFPRPITLLNRIIPLMKNSRWGLAYPMKLVSNYIATEVLEGRAVQDVINKLMELGMGHIDTTMWGGMVDEERVLEVRTPLDDEYPDATLPSTSSPSKEASSSLTTVDAPPLPSSPLPPTSPSTSLDEKAKPKRFRLYAQMVAPTLLQHFPLPPFSPPLYRAGGARERIQSLNWVTGEVALKLYEAELATIKFDEAKVAFEPSSSVFYPTTTDETAGKELLITLSDFSVLFESHFNFSAPMSPLLKWGTGVKALSSTGLCSTSLIAHTLQLRFLLLPTPSPSGKSAFTLTSTSITPFSSVTPVLTLASSSPLLKLGTDAVNALTKALSPQIAIAVSAVVMELMKEKVRDLLQDLLESVEESVREKGGELPTSWRGH